ncbi:hypothetical protein PF006_g17438 [Phytophthora fragariae]|uniref:Uncharacterized protein n=2 Tax=Phytophthora fragariae TaxID=53985 RepID=A0A6A3SSY3_9STRA|nr:hypothetical protein PF006_g17438 [Phytophthora fragariae]
MGVLGGLVIGGARVGGGLGLGGVCGGAELGLGLGLGGAMSVPSVDSYSDSDLVGHVSAVGSHVEVRMNLHVQVANVYELADSL